MTEEKPDLVVMRRLLHRHQWTDVGEWGRAFGALADLSDGEIDAVVSSERDAADGVAAPLDLTQR